jgi:hypothetical protein
MDKVPVMFYKKSVILVIVLFLSLGIQPVFANNIYNNELEQVKILKLKNLNLMRRL